MTTAATAPEGFAPTSAEADAPPATPAECLDYATPWPRHRWAPSALAHRLFWHAVRKTVFAAGLGLMCYGILRANSPYDPARGAAVAGWGAAFAGLMVPFPFRRHADISCDACARRASRRSCGI